MKIALCIGHNEEKRGAVGSESISEWSFNNEFVNDLLKELKDSEHEFKAFTRLPLDGYTKQMDKLHSDLDKWGTHLAVSFHFNASEMDANGHEVLYYSPTGLKYASLLNSHFNNFLDNRDRGCKKKNVSERGGQFLCRGNYICILPEPFFAKYQYRYIRDGIRREALIQAYVEFFKDIKKEGIIN